MPGFNGSGPEGAGPLTGGERGFCRPAMNWDRPRYAGRFFDRMNCRQGYGFGRKWRGFGRRFGGGNAAGYEPLNAETATAEINSLKTHAVSLEGQLAEIQRRIDRLERNGVSPVDTENNDD